MIKIALIVAMDEQRGIGRNNDLMWNLPSDMRFFKSTTQGHIVVMGRKNFDSIPETYRPLPQRLNCVLSRSSDFTLPGCLVFQNLQECVQQFHEDSRTLFIIGGGEIYRLAMEELSMDEMYITKIDGVFGADTFFPIFDEGAWDIKILKTQEIDDKHSHRFTIYKYIRR